MMDNKIEKVKKLVDMLFDYLDHADFSNGNVIQGTDEGQATAWMGIQELKKEWNALYTSPTPKEETQQVVCPKTDKCIRSKPRPCGHDEPHKIRSNCDKAGLCPACIPVPSTAKPETHLICPKPCKDHPKCECRVPHIENHQGRGG